MDSREYATARVGIVLIAAGAAAGTAGFVLYKALEQPWALTAIYAGFVAAAGGLLLRVAGQRL